MLQSFQLFLYVVGSSRHFLYIPYYLYIGERKFQILEYK